MAKKNHGDLWFLYGIQKPSWLEYQYELEANAYLFAI